MNEINISPKEFADNLFGPEDERKAKCIHCGAIWYAIHYKDGVCYTCQKKNLPGESIIVRRAIMKRNLIYGIISIILLLIVILATA